MANVERLGFYQRLGFGWALPVVAYWVVLYIATRNADPMAFPMIFAAAVLVPIANAWVLLPKLPSRASAVLVGAVVPAAVLALWVI